MILLVVGLCIAIMAVLALYFTMQSLTLIFTVIVGVGACILFIAAWQMAQKKHLLAPIFHVLAAILLFSMSIRICTTYFSGNNMVLFCLIAMNCVIWLLVRYQNETSIFHSLRCFRINSTDWVLYHKFILI